MRMRPKKNRDARLEKVSGLLAELDGGRVKLSPAFGEGRELFVELGCGKGAFITGLSERFPDASLLGRRESDGCGDDGRWKRPTAPDAANVRFLIADGAAIDMAAAGSIRSRGCISISATRGRKSATQKGRLSKPPFSGTL